MNSSDTTNITNLPKIYCTQCRSQLNATNSRFDKQGRRMKTCIKHGNKRTLPEIEHWDSFMHEIKSWSHPGQTNLLDILYTFDLDQLPVNFGQPLESNDNNESEFDPLGKVICQLFDLIQEAGGHRFRQSKIVKSNNPTYIYHCCQDSSRYSKSKSTGMRDRLQMERFPCDGRLEAKVDLFNRQLILALKHSYHIPYVNTHLSEVALEFISKKCIGNTPAQVHRELLDSNIPNKGLFAQHQVYYQWQQANSGAWKRDPEQFLSASKFLTGSGNEYRHEIFKSGNIRGLAIYVGVSISVLVSQARELVIDATYGTNNLGMNLTAVLAELDGTGVPLCYLFTGTDNLPEVSRTSNDGATTRILEQFLQPLKDAGFAPSFFGCDKDQSEISAIRKIWPRTTVQLCFWHAKRAIRKKLSDASKTRTQRNYFPMVAKAFVPALEICWGSTSTHRPNGDHRYARCQCVSSNNTFPELGNLECVDILERNTVLEMFSRHYNMHYFIPDQNGTNRSAEQIYSSCVNEVYEWCYSRNYFRLWAYLFVNWYAPENWKLWARSVDPDRVPVLKTTMIIESHWRKIKHDYLHQFNRLRIDLVTWVIFSRVAPQAIERMKALLKDDRRTRKAAWRKDFKKQWKHLQSSIVDPQSLLRYHTIPSKWTCSCQAFLLSHFLLCKHILCCYEFVPDPARFFREVPRQRYCPFWGGEQLSLRPENRVQDIDLFPTASGQIPNDNTSFGSDSVEVDVIAESEDGDGDEAPQFDAKKMIEATISILTLLEEQEKIGNIKFLEIYYCHKNQHCSHMILLEEIGQRKRQGTMPKTRTS